MTAHNATVAEAYTTYTTAPGERATITLPDGGTVALNVASRLKVPLNYMTDNHTVRLDGEGLFTVPHRTGTSLTVIAGAATVRVLGTSFTVRHYVTDTVTTVAVRDGKVAVGSAVVTANRSVVVGRNGIPSSQPVDTSLFTFATGTLTLNGLSLPAAIVELDRWYDADIRLADSTLTARRIGGEFATGSLADLVTILKMTLNVRVVRDGRVLTIFSER
ncbi:MAG TPA: FecR domain-containing protein [Gemmatimonadaceae bacterium]|nr:FecR domain-containing protein [Gemmatimonadaceae bacterium]